MTESRLRSYITNKLRTVQNWTDEHKLARQAAKVGPNLFRCAKCNGAFRRDETALDHKLPVVDPVVGFVDWNTYMSRLFCTADNLQVLCKADHAAKTLAENELREKHGTGRFSAAARARLAKALSGNTNPVGTTRSGACRLVMSRVRKGRPQTEARKEALRRVQEAGKRTIIAVETRTGIETKYASAADAAVSLGVSSANISKIASGLPGRTQSKGFTFKFEGV